MLTIQQQKEYLENYFRYYTMNSWNRSTSYARNVKLYKFVPRELLDKAYSILEQGSVFDEINDAIREFEISHDYLWQVGFNGRSGGYLVLYSGGKKDSGYKTRCNTCGKLTWYETEQPCHCSGCTGTLKTLSKPVYQTFTYAGKGIDESKDYDDWDDYSIQERYELVKEFDALVEKCKGIFLDYCNYYAVVEQEILVPKKIKVLQEA